jgi:REP element-mobilizing transposase RayT
MQARKRNRKNGFDYTTNAIYFLTVCCANRNSYFGSIENDEMQLNEYGKVAEQQIEWLVQRYSYMVMHHFVVMPNHVHLLIEIAEQEVEHTLLKIKSVSQLVGAFKTTTSKIIHRMGNVEFYWQRSFHDHIVRTSESYNRIYDYISDNPRRWNDDSLK